MNSSPDSKPTSINHLNDTVLNILKEQGNYIYNNADAATLNQNREKRPIQLIDNVQLNA